MKLTRVLIRNFKAIEETVIELRDVTVIVGENGSGKSSILQALHWMFQSGRNHTIEARKQKNEGSTLSEKNATYMPSPEYRNAGHGAEYGNKGGTPQLDMSIAAVDHDDNCHIADMWIKSARNEGLSVHVPAGNEFVRKLRDQRNEFSAYIPGLAGIPLIEEKRSKLIVHRQAAAGDANTVLRNILFLLKGKDIDGIDGLNRVQDLVSKVMGEIKLRVEFDEGTHTVIQADIQTSDMRAADTKRFKPLELSGIGFLQVIQIFAYLLYFRPVVLLVDEPDSHLHPATQERLIQSLAEAARTFGTQLVLTTHSPSVVRALPQGAKVVWMKDGKVQPDADTTARQKMGWGLLDKRILLLSEDSNVAMLRSLLSQWPDIERVTAIWPLHGSGKMPPPDGLASLQELLGGSVKIVLHRDRDFMMTREADAFSGPYQEKGIEVWLTRHSDIEAYWGHHDVLEAHFCIDPGDARLIIETATKRARHDDNDAQVRNRKRNDIRSKISECRNGNIGNYNDQEVIDAYRANGEQYVVLGKTLCEKIREVAHELGHHDYQKFGKTIPNSLISELADDLFELLSSQLSN